MDRMHQYLEYGVREFPNHTAVEEPGKGSITYSDLNALADQLCRRLLRLGVRRGDRVGIYLHKSIDAVASIMGILKTGAAYVPVDPLAPASRNAFIFNNCAVKTVIV